MNNLLRIVATINSLQLLQNTVEQLAKQNNRNVFCERFETSDWQPVNSSSVEFHVDGDLVFSTATVTASSFTAGFLFTCLNQKQAGYKLNWSLSLS